MSHKTRRADWAAGPKRNSAMLGRDWTLLGWGEDGEATKGCWQPPSLPGIMSLPLNLQPLPATLAGKLTPGGRTGLDPGTWNNPPSPGSKVIGMLVGGPDPSCHVRGMKPLAANASPPPQEASEQNDISRTVQRPLQAGYPDCPTTSSSALPSSTKTTPTLHMD